MTTSVKASNAVQLTVAAILACAAAQAADQLATPDDELETVVVTAQKRSEDIRTVPISISVMSQEQLQQRQITSIDDIARSVPDVAITSSGGNTGMNNYAIRGVASTSGPATLGQQTVGMYLDDVSMSTPTGATIGSTALKIFDINHVEVLRGPQGTLYGASSMGGTIRFVSNEPDLNKFGGSALATVSSTEHGGINYVGQSVINAPLIDGQLGLRVGAQVTKDSGYITVHNLWNGTSTDDANSESSSVIRASLKYLSDDGTLTILPSVYLQRVNAYGTNSYDPGSLSADYYLDQVSRDELFVPSLTVKKDLGWADVTSATNYFWRNYAGITDGTAGLTEPAVGFAWPTPFRFPIKVMQISEELRMTSKTMEESGKPYSWIAGVYASKNRSKVGNYLNVDDYAGFAEAVENALGSDADSVLQYGDNMYSQASFAAIEQYSGFGEFSYALTKKLIATAGFRYLTAHETAGNTSGGYYNGGVSSYKTSIGSSATTPKLALRYAVTDDTSVYTNVVKGFRLGGTNLPVPTDTSNSVGAGCYADLQALGMESSPLSYKPDSLWSYELGAKSSFFGNRLSVDAAAYHIKWNDVQQDITMSSPEACAFDFVANVGQAKSEGLDYELRAKLTSHLETSLGGNFTHAVITKTTSGTGASEGDWLLGVPRWTVSAGSVYSVPFQSFAGRLNLDGHWIGPSRNSFDPTSVAYEGQEYFLLDASLSADFDKWSLSLFAKNALNMDKALTQSSIPPYQVTSVRPRTIGLTAQVKF